MIDVDQIPDELKKLKQWICHNEAKEPYTPGSKNRAAVNKPYHWRQYETALKHFQAGKHAGIGFVFTEGDPYCGIDLDHSIDEAGNIETWASDLLNRFKSYAEKSPSGSGIHIIIKGELQGPGTKNELPGYPGSVVEIYDKGRYFTMTGNVIEGYESIQERQADVDWLYKLLKPEKKPTTKIAETKPSGLTDEEILELANNAKNREKFQRLMDGNTEGYESESEADLALTSIIAFYSQEQDQVRRILQQSALWDKKWEREDYFQRTFNKAISNLPKTHQGSQQTITHIGEDEDINIAPGEPLPAIPPFTDDLIPTQGILREYIDYMLPITEAPVQFHLFAGLIMLSTVIGKRISFITADQKTYCNLWTVLIGRSGSKKSTSIRRPRSILSDIEMKKFIFPTQVTSERLIPMLVENSVGTFFWSEWGATMDQWGKTYAMDTMSIFTELYDSGYFSRWLKAEKYEIDDSCINLFCGCTYSWLKKTMSKGDIAMGFWPRFLFVPAGKRDKYLAIPPKGDSELLERIKAQLKTMKDIFPEMYPLEADMSEAEPVYKEWYDDINEYADSNSCSDEIASFIGRLSEYAKKIAILVEASQKKWTDHDIIIKPETMEYSIRLSNWLLNTMKYVLGTVQKTELDETEEKVYQFIYSAGPEGILHRELRHGLSTITKGKIDLALESLIDAERILAITTNKKGRGRPGRKYIAGSLIS